MSFSLKKSTDQLLSRKEIDFYVPIFSFFLVSWLINLDKIVVI